MVYYFWWVNHWEGNRISAQNRGKLWQKYWPVSYTHLDVYKRQPVDSIQYELIDKQFDCMAKYLSWDMLFKKSYYATARDELEKNKDSMNELEGIGKNL